MDADSATSVYPADVDGDGLMDVLCTSSAQNEIKWYHNEGGGLFSTQRIISTSYTGARSVHAADLDGDGCVDVLIAASSKDPDTDVIAWCQNNRANGFRCDVVTTAVLSPQSVFAADLDQDGQVDIVSASSGDRKVAWYRNEGNATFVAQRLINTDAATSLYAADLDGDGFIDVLCISQSYFPAQITWYRNEGGGKFLSQRMIASEAHGASTVYAADIDDDGRLDLLATSADGNKVLWYRNEGGGAFSLEQVVSNTVAGTTSVYAADLDRDGRLDVLSAGSDGVMWHPRFAYTLVSLSSNASDESDEQPNGNSSFGTSVSLTATTPTMIHIERDTRIVEPWLFGVGFSFEMNGRGATLQCDIVNFLEPCIKVLARQTATFRNFTLRGNCPTLFAVQFVRFLNLEQITFQRDGPALGFGPMIRIVSQRPPMQTGSVAVFNVSVQHFAPQGSFLQISAALKLNVVDALFQGLVYPTHMPGSGNFRSLDFFHIFDIVDTVNVRLSHITAQELYGCMSVIHLARAGHIEMHKVVVENSMLTTPSSAISHIDQVRSFRLSASTFASNTCNNCTSGVFLLHDVGLLNMSSSRFINNTCLNCTGGAMGLKFSSVVTTVASNNVSFVKNLATRGGAVAVLDETISLDPWRPSLSLTFAKILFRGNSALQAGGAVYWYSALKFTLPHGIQYQLQDQPASALLQNCTFLNNDALEGGAVAVINSNIIVRLSAFQENRATAAGAGVWLLSSSGVFSECRWEGNVVAVPLSSAVSGKCGGAALYAVDCLASGVSIVDSDLVNNTARGETAPGGAVHAVQCAIRLVGSLLKYNSAINDCGGAVTCTGCDLLHVEDTSMQSNVAALAGGAVLAQNTDITSNQWYCSGNVVAALGSNARGGGCLAAISSTVDISNSTTFAGNQVLGAVGVGGNAFIDCTSTIAVAGSSNMSMGSAAVGSDIFAECFGVPDASLHQIPQRIRYSSTIHSGTHHLQLAGEPSVLINSIAAVKPVASFRLLDAFGNHRWEDNSTLCTVAAIGRDSGQPVVLLSSTRFLAVNGYVALHPFSVLAEQSDTAVVLSVKCTTPAMVELSETAIVALVVPTVALTPPLPPATVATQQLFQIHLQVHSNASIPRDLVTLACVVECENAIAMSGTRATSSNDRVDLDSVAITGLIGESYELRVGCTLGSTQLVPPPLTTVRIATCSRGAEPDDSNTQCRLCPLNTYSEGGDNKCRRCPPKGATCSSGIITLQQGYFPADTRLLKLSPSAFLSGNASNNDLVMDETIVLYPCWNREACEFNGANRTYGCGLGYTGPLCGVCDTSANFVRSGNSCIECWPHGLNIMIILAFLTVLIIGLIYIAVFQSVKKASPGKIALRILLTYIQMLSSLGLFQAQATQTFRDIFGVSDVLGGSFVSWPPLQCTLGLSYYMKFIVNISLPFLMVPLSITLAAITLSIRAACASERWRHATAVRVVRRCVAVSKVESRIPTSPVVAKGHHQGHHCSDFKSYLRSKAYLAPAVFVLFLSYNVISTTAAKMFQCRPETIDGRRFLEANLAIPCYDTFHVSGMVAAGCIGLAFNVGMPLLLWLFLRRNKHRLHDSKVFSRFGFLYQGYSASRGRYAWESVVLLRKFFIVMVGSTVEDPWYQAVAGISFVVIALVVQVGFRPYDARIYNQLETAVLSVLATTQVVSLIYLRSETVPMSADERFRIDVVVTVLLVLLNGGMFGTLLYFILKRSRCFSKCRGAKITVGSSKHIKFENSPTMIWNPLRQRSRLIASPGQPNQRVEKAFEKGVEG